MNNLIHFTNLNANILQTLGPLPIYLLIFAVIYFIMIRPQVRQQKEHTASTWFRTGSKHDMLL